MPNKWGHQNNWGGGISENFNKWEDQNKWGEGNWRKPGRATKQASHDTTECACYGVQFLAGNFTPKMHTHKRKVLAEHLLFLLWPVIHYWT